MLGGPENYVSRLVRYGDMEACQILTRMLFLPHTACPAIVPRSAWEARETHCPSMTLPAKYIIVIHTAKRTCNTSDECRPQVQTMQSLFIDRFRACDIGYK